jgi:hypothetical protein
MDDAVPEVVAPSIEDQAREMGWKPLEEYEGEPSKWVSPEIFVARAPLFEKIEGTTKDNKQLRREVDTLRMSINELKAHTERVRQTEYTRALNELKAAKRQALAEENPLRAEDIQEQIEEIKEAQKKVEPTQPPPSNEPPAAFVSWVAENEWYKLDPELREFADAFGIVEHNKGKSAEDVLKSITATVRKRFPEKFRNPMKDKAPSVETSSPAPATKKTGGYKITAQDRAIAERFAATGVMTVEQYYKDLQAMYDQENS